MCTQWKDTQVCSFQRLGVQFSLILLYLFSDKCSLSSFCSMESTVILFPFFSLYYSLILFFLDCWAGLKKSWERWWNRRWAHRTQGTRYWTQLSPNIFLHSLLSTLSTRKVGWRLCDSQCHRFLSWNSAVCVCAQTYLRSFLSSPRSRSGSGDAQLPVLPVLPSLPRKESFSLYFFFQWF